MAIGDDAVAAGMALVVGGTDLVKDGADHHNTTRDYVAQRTSAITPVSKGGTGASNAGAARTNLGAAAASHTHSAADITSGTLNIPGAIYAHGINSMSGSIVSSGDIGAAGKVQAVESRVYPVGGSWVTAALDGSGYLGIVPSAERFKQDIAPRVYTLAEAATIGRLVVEYRLKASVEELGAAAVFEVGIIAERLAHAGFPEFVVYGPEGEVLSIHYSAMVTVALSAFVEIDARLAALEGNRA
jgi:hypothetical protein